MSGSVVAPPAETRPPKAIPGDGDVVEGMAVVDESAITGESAPVIRESGGDRSAVTGGTVVLSERIVVQITSNPGETFLDRMIALVEGASRQKTPNEVALDILIAGLTLVLLVAVVTLQPMAIYDKAIQSTAVLVALFVCLAPTTIGGLLSAIGIAGMDRMVQRNVLAMSGRAIEAAGDASTLLLDKTGTITYGNRMASEFIPVAGVSETELAEAALRSSLADETPEGRSIVELAENHYKLPEPDLAGAELVPFSAQTRMSGVPGCQRRQPGREHGGQGDPVRPRGVRPDDRRDHGHHGGRHRFRAGQLYPGRRQRSVRGHPAWRGQPRRRRRRAVLHPGARAAGGVRGRADGRPHPGIPRQEDPRAADEVGRDLRADHPGHRPDLRQHLAGDLGRHVLDPQPRLPRPERDHLRLRLGGQQQDPRSPGWPRTRPGTTSPWA